MQGAHNAHMLPNDSGCGLSERAFQLGVGGCELLVEAEAAEGWQRVEAS